VIRQRAALAYASAALLLMITGCTGGGPNSELPSPTETRHGSSTVAAPGTPHSKDYPGPHSTSRPIEPVPAVRPPGFVDPPSGHAMAAYTHQSVDWRPCPTKTAEMKQCASVLAPLDYRHPGRQAVTLVLARLPSTSSEAEGVLFTNPGGPGASGVDFLDSFDPRGLQQSYDLVSWDVRGTGRSTPVECFTNRQMERYVAADYSPDNAAEVQQLIDLNTDFGRTCLARSGKLLKHISTEDTVHDLELLRRLLAQRRLNYFGFSYGTSIGAMYATLFPERVGRMALDGATSIGGVPTVSQTYGFNRTLGNFATWCARQDCRLGDSQEQVEATIRDFLQRLDHDTIPGGRRDLTQALATSGLTFAMYSPQSSWPTVLNGLEKAIYADNGTSLLAWADAYYQRDRAGQFGQFNAAFPAIRCLDERDHGVAGELSRWRREAKRAATFGPFIGPDFTCATWPVRSTGDTDRKIVYTGRPAILILGTTGDPATPYEYAEHMHEALRSSRLITFEGNGHLAFDQSSCVQRKVLDYFAGTTPDNSRCG
jgi:pimeloyl-ACP methyl ester carboxylesterase